MNGLKLTVALAVLFNLSKLGLELAHELGLMELALDQGPHAKLNNNNEENNRKAKITDEVVDEKEDVGDGTNDDEVYEIKYKHNLPYCNILSSNRERRSF